MSGQAPLTFMLALLRYRRIPHAVIWGSHASLPAGYPEPKVKLLPTFYFADADGEREAVVDSTPIAQRLEREHAGRSVVPDDPALAFYCALIEDYADEWLTKPMFHYRWHHQTDRDHSARYLAFTSDPSLEAGEAEAFAKTFTERQHGRLYVVGSNDITATTIEASYIRFLDQLDAALQRHPFLFGTRPSIADFAVFGQLTQLGQVDPTPRALLVKHAPRIEAWLSQVEDLSGLEPEDEGWIEPEAAGEHLAELLDEIGRTYLPVLVANAQAHADQEQQFTTVIDGAEWTQPTFPYQVKCLAELRHRLSELPNHQRSAAASTLESHGCEALTWGRE